MPVYEYECKKCKTIHDRFWPSHDPPKQVKCNKKKCRGKAIKIISGGQAFHFKGEGTYNKGWDFPEIPVKKDKQV